MKFIDHDTREEWLAARTNFIGASESAPILGYGYSNQNALTVYASKVAPEDPETRKEVGDNVIVGSLIEPGLIAIFSHFTGLPARLEVPYRVHILDEYPFIGATKDAYAWFEDGIDIPVELKNVDMRLMSKWYEDQTPVMFQIQCQHQMIVSDVGRMFLMGLLGGNKPMIREIIRDYDFGEMLLAKLVEFWGFVQRKEIPKDFDDWQSDATADALRRLHPEDNGLTTLLDADGDAWYNAWKYFGEQRKKYESLEKEAKNRLKEAIGENTYGLTPNGHYIGLKTINMPEQIRAATSFRRLSEVKPNSKGRRQ